jgi:hypothetical protein
VDALIRSILEVSNEMRQLTDRLAAAFSWFGETLKLREEAVGMAPSAGGTVEGKSGAAEAVTPSLQLEAAGQAPESAEAVQEAEPVER